MTYGRLENRANQLARYLIARGVRRGSNVAMLLPRSLDTYIALLAILKAGAAYVPIDPAYPADRIACILNDSEAIALVTTADLARGRTEFRGEIVRVDADASAIAFEIPMPLRWDSARVDPCDPCYVIYTSGSTGRPKGVIVEHRNVCHLVQEEGRIFAVRPEDRVYQGASLAFDLSVEEIWLAFQAGAALVAATPEMLHAGPELARQLAAYGVTVLSCVPTLVSMLTEDVPTLRLLILGGETCGEQLVARWARPGLRIVNTYGPTEATVIATCTDVYTGKPVTLGRPISGCYIHILDEELRLVPRGRKGEICIGGAGVARGYLGLPAETAARFVPDPFAGRDDPDARIYRTGDMGRVDSHGNLQFLGRTDAQVKIRGLRVDLGEIESVMLQAPDVLSAACTVRENGGIQRLVGYVVPRAGGTVDGERLGAHLRKQLPPWIVPAFIEMVSDLPRLSSGKLDRASLPEPRPRAPKQQGCPEHLWTATERRLMEVWNTLFRPLPVCLDDDFFLDLGGHSLLAAKMVSQLRKDPQFVSLAVVDVYEHPTIARLAAALDSAPQPTAAPVASRRDPPERHAGTRHFLAGVVQSASLYLVFGFRGLPSVAPYLIYFLLARNRPVLNAAAWAAAGAVAVLPIMMIVAVATKWLLLGRILPGRHPLWGWYYLRWWFVQVLVDSVPLNLLGGTPWLPWVYRLLGVRIGKNVHLATTRLGAFDLISIGEGASVEEGASLLGYAVRDGFLVIEPVSVGRGCLVGARSVLCGHTAMEDGARLEDLSLLPSGARVPAGETWAGSPPRRVFPEKTERNPAPQRGGFHQCLAISLYAAIMLGFPLVELLAFVPGIALLSRLHSAQGVFCLAVPLAGASFIACLTAEVVLLKWMLIGRARPGTYPVHGRFYVRNWIVEQLLALGVEVAGPLHATLYVKPWYRALGVKLGRFVELSTAATTTPDLLAIQDDATIADEVSLGAARVEAGWLTLAPTKLGRRAFVGNSAVIPAGVTLGDDSLVGVLTIAPEDQSQTPGATWLGSPPIRLPRRQPSPGFSEQHTFRPSRKMQWSRACFEIPRVTLPGAGFIVVTLAVIETALKLWNPMGPAKALLCLPAIYGACCAAALAVVALVKWIVMGRYQPFARPLWSAFLWRLEFVNALFEFFATPLALEVLQGTPLLPWYLRLLGARIGRRVYIHSTGFLEFDLVEIGDRSILNQGCILQTHLFEDRILKASRLRIGADCEIGAQSVVLYDAEMQDGARLGPLSLLMKGECLPAGTEWMGNPLAAVDGADRVCGGHARGAAQ
jgi:non-ribosomal peptide synthetase-like protein